MRRTTMAALAAGLSIVLVGARPSAASAQEAQIQRLGDNFDVVWTGDPPRDNLVGGGWIRRDGGGDDSTATALAPPLFGEPVFATLSGGGDDMTLLRRPVPSGQAEAPMLATRTESGAARAALR